MANPSYDTAVSLLLSIGGIHAGHSPELRKTVGQRCVAIRDWSCPRGSGVAIGYGPVGILTVGTNRGRLAGRVSKGVHLRSLSSIKTASDGFSALPVRQWQAAVSNGGVSRRAS